MSNWLDKALGRKAEAVQAVPYELVCVCGAHLNGVRGERARRVICAQCGEAHFVLPVNHYPVSERKHFGPKGPDPDATEPDLRVESPESPAAEPSPLPLPAPSLSKPDQPPAPEDDLLPSSLDMPPSLPKSEVPGSEPSDSEPSLLPPLPAPPRRPTPIPTSKPTPRAAPRPAEKSERSEPAAPQKANANEKKPDEKKRDRKSPESDDNGYRLTPTEMEDLRESDHDWSVSPSEDDVDLSHALAESQKLPSINPEDDEPGDSLLPKPSEEEQRPRRKKRQEKQEDEWLNQPVQDKDDARRGLVIVATALILLVGGMGLWLMRSQSFDRAQAEYLRSSKVGLQAFDEGDFEIAHRELEIAMQSLDRLGTSSPETDRVRRRFQQAQAATHLFDNAPSEIPQLVEPHLSKPPEELEAIVDPYRTRWLFLDLSPVQIVPAPAQLGEDRVPGRRVRYPLMSGGRPVLLSGLEPLLATLEKTGPVSRLIVAARFEHCRSEDNGATWVVEFNPESAFLIHSHRMVRQLGLIPDDDTNSIALIAAQAHATSELADGESAPAAGSTTSASMEPSQTTDPAKDAK